MGRKARRRRHDERVPRYVLIGGVVILILFAAFMVKIVSQHDRSLRLQAGLTGGPLPLASAAWDPKGSSLPQAHYPPPQPMDAVQAAYAFAARKADVLQYIPCYCGCERHGHRSNVSCYVKDWNAQGMPNWDDHSLGCGLCLNITHDVMRLDAAGTPLAEIRETIEARYVPQYGRGTPTPPVP